MKSWITFGAAAAALVAVAGTAVTVSAQSGEEQVDARQEYMKQLGGAAGTIGKYYRDSEGTIEDVRQAAARLGELAPQLPDQFPEGTGVGVGDSDALLAIWEHPGDFDAVVVAAVENMEALGSVAESASENELRAAFARVGQSCGACHEDFRQQD